MAVKKVQVRKEHNHVVGAWVLIVLGILFLLQNLLGLNLGAVWPIVLIAVGVGVLYSSSQK